jgi:hypothetical protein
MRVSFKSSKLSASIVVLLFAIHLVPGHGTALAALIVTSNVLAGPANILKGSSANYSLTVSGTGAGAGTPLLYSILANADDPPVLVDDTQFTAIDDAAGNWTFKTEFTLKCTADCMIMGSTTASALAPAAISALIEQEISRNNFRNLSISNEIMVNCVTCLPRIENAEHISRLSLVTPFEYCPIPEPSSALMLLSGYALWSLISRRRHSLQRLSS